MSEKLINRINNKKQQEVIVQHTNANQLNESEIITNFLKLFFIQANNCLDLTKTAIIILYAAVLPIEMIRESKFLLHLPEFWKQFRKIWSQDQYPYRVNNGEEVVFNLQTVVCMGDRSDWETSEINTLKQVLFKIKYFFLIIIYFFSTFSNLELERIYFLHLKKLFLRNKNTYNLNQSEH